MTNRTTCHSGNCDTVARAYASVRICRSEAKRLNAKIRRTNQKLGRRLFELKGQTFEERQADPQVKELNEELDWMELAKQDYLTTARMDRETIKRIEAEGICFLHGAEIIR